jgi:predicted NAD/FAD-binding protein
MGDVYIIEIVGLVSFIVILSFQIMAQVHTDESILPSSVRGEIPKDFANYVEILPPKTEIERQQKKLRYENSFILSWSPSLRGAPDTKIVSYNNSKAVDPQKLAKTCYHVRDHPEFHPFNMLVSLVLYFIQGSRRGRLWYCGSSTTPGNGHDLSLLSGFVIAHRLGAKYPFPNNAGAIQDFELLRKMMMSARIWSGFFLKLASMSGLMVMGSILFKAWLQRNRGAR